MSEAKVPALLILNQMAGPMTWELAEDLGQALGQAALLTGHPDTLAKKGRETVQLYRAAPYQRAGYARRVLSWLHYLVQAFLWLWRMPPETPLLLFSNPPLLPWLGYLMRRLRGQHYAVMVHDIWPDSLVRLGILSASHLVIRVWRWLNRRAYENAEVVMTLGETMAANLARQFDPGRTETGRIEVIYPWADTDLIRPLPKEENWFAQKYDQAGKLTVMYSGNMGLTHDIETMLAAAQGLQDVPGVHFMFIGAGPKWKLVEETIHAERLLNVTLLPWQPEVVIPHSLATADVALVSLEDGIEGLAVPSKAVYAMAAGSALMVLAHGENELCAWLEQFRCGVTIDPDTGGILREVRRLLDDNDYLQVCRQNARLAAEQVFSRKANVQRAIRAIGSFLPDGQHVQHTSHV